MKPNLQLGPFLRKARVMSILWEVVFLVLFSGSRHRSSAICREAIFKPTKHPVFLKIIKNSRVSSVLECAHHCRATEKCEAFKHKNINDGINCQVSTGKPEYLIEETEEKQWTVYTTSEKLLKLEDLREKNKIYPSCKSAFEKIGGAKTGMYKIATVSGYTYCHMTSLPRCSGGGWTLVMKVNGTKETFKYDSSYWSNNATYNPGGGQTGFDEQETKLATYWNTPFKEICLGMKANNSLKFISISYQASSLYSVIADGKYRPTNIGRSKWLSMISGSDLQPYCTREGFNFVGGYYSVRIGVTGDEYNNCISPDSYVGFGGISKNKRTGCSMPTISNTCGNVAYCMLSGRPNKEIPAMGYILVR